MPSWLIVLIVAVMVYSLLRLSEPYWHKTHTCHRLPGHDGNHRCYLCGEEWE